MPFSQDKAQSATRSIGLAKLASFLPRAGDHYGSMRNFDEGPGPRQHVSVLSPWISRRLVAEAEVITQVTTYHPGSETSCHPFLKEVLWRGYWRSYLEHRPSIWTEYRHMLAEHNPAHDPRYHEVTQGKSGIQVFDHWVEELQTEGYLHNHARLWVASIWIHTLRLPWQWGAAWFLEHLLDGDAASNTLSWRWVAGLHTKGKAYLASSENISKFTNRRLTPRLPASSLAQVLDHAEYPLCAPSLAPPLSRSSIGAEGALLLLGDDLSIETLKSIRDHPLMAITWASAEKVASAFGWRAQVQKFHEQALQDASSRAQGLWPHARRSPLPTSAKGVEQTLAEWRGLGIKRILVPAPHQGPYREIWQEIRPLLGDFDVILFNREYDRELAPLGKKGFFDFWNHRPDWQRLCRD